MSWDAVRGRAIAGTTGRREFLRRLGTAAAVTLLLPARPAAGTPSAPRDATPRERAWRLSMAGHRSCNACRSHARNRFYRTREAAAADRAHAGCNCRIVGHRLPVDQYRRYFRARRDVYDRRWGFPGEPASRERRALRKG